MRRRRLLQRSVVGLSAFFSGLQSCGFSDRKRPYDAWNWEPASGGYGQLSPAGAELALPPGFQYRTLSIDGQLMSDKHPTPPLPDGMASFALPNGNIQLMRNHEVNPIQAGIDAKNSTLAYDPAATGGVSSLEIDPNTRKIVRDFVALLGTVRNCSGGATPWGTWLSCEETMSFSKDGLSKPHGYVFEVPVLATEPVRASPIKELGRFVHESIAIDKHTGIVYQTEDTNIAGFYRFMPNKIVTGKQRIDFSASGQLQALRIPDEPGIRLKEVDKAGVKFTIDWVPISEPDPPFNVALSDLNSNTVPPVFQQALNQGAAVFSNGEGCVYRESAVWFTCTRAGHGHGQVWRLTPKNSKTGVLELMYASTNKHILDGPDNLCLSPQGSLIICEDSNSDPKRVVALTADGSIIPIAENIIDDEEFAGATFSPDGKTLFVNIQGDVDDNLPGRTLAIWGPWEKGMV